MIKLNDFFKINNTYIVINHCLNTKILKKVLRIENDTITWKDTNGIVTNLYIGPKTQLYYDNKFKFVNTTLEVSNLIHGMFLTVLPCK